MEHLAQYVGDRHRVQHVGKAGSAACECGGKKLQIGLIGSDAESAQRQEASCPEQRPLSPIAGARKRGNEEDGCERKVREALNDAQGAWLDTQHVLDKEACPDQADASEPEQARNAPGSVKEPR